MNKNYLPADIKTFLNNANPHLPFPDNYFDVVTAFSVFTHIDQFEDAWLLELRRITCDDGLLYLTTQNDASWKQTTIKPGHFEHFVRANKIPGNLEITKDIFSRPMPRERIVLRMSTADVYNCNVWHSNNYLHKRWAQYFDILHIANNGHSSFQSPVIMKPRANDLDKSLTGTTIGASVENNDDASFKHKPR